MRLLSEHEFKALVLTMLGRIEHALVTLGERSNHFSDAVPHGGNGAADERDEATQEQSEADKPFQKILY